MPKEENLIELQNKDLKTLYSICKKLRQVTEPIPAWKISDRRMAVEDAKKPLDEVEALPERVQQYRRKDQHILQKYGDVLETFPQPDGSSITKFDLTDPEGERARKDLKEEYKEDLDAEQKRREGIRLLLEQTVTLEFIPFEYEWCKAFLNGDDLVFLRRHGLILPPKALSSRPKPKSKPKKKR